MKLRLECVVCYLRQALDAAKMATDDKNLHEEVLRKSLAIASDFNLDSCGFILQGKIKKMIEKILPKSDPYSRVKKKFNSIALGMENRLKDIIKNSEDPFETSLRISLAGNIIDFGPGIKLNETVLNEAIKKSFSQKLDRKRVELLKKNIDEAKKILFIGDNAGEIVMDKIFLEYLPREKITYVVRGGPAINDSTMEDAEAVGMVDYVNVVTTGLDMPAAILPYCSKEFLDEYNMSDLVIAKGQGNYEVLCDEEKNIFFLLKIKCPVVADTFKDKYEVGDIVLYKK